MRHVAAIDDTPAANAVKPEAALEEANSDVVDNMANAAPISKQAALVATAPPLAWLPISVILVATFTNIAVYGVECASTPSISFGFGWSGAAIGAAQMAGVSLDSRSRRIDTRLHHPSGRRPAPLHPVSSARCSALRSPWPSSGQPRRQ